MSLLPVVFIFIVGSALFSRCWSFSESSSFRFALAWGLGAAFFMFFSVFMVLVTGSFNPAVVVILSFIVITVCLFRVLQMPWNRAFWLTFCSWGLLFGFACWVASLHPYGEWDSWAFWQVRARFIFEAPERWHNTLTMSYQAAHPWFLPFLTAWGLAFSGTETFIVPFLLGSFTCTAIILFLFGAMSGRGPWAWLTAGYLAVQPSFWWLGTSQYADVWVAYYILAAAALFLLLDEEKMPLSAASCIGFFLGCASFLKTDGALLSSFFTIFILIYSMYRGLWRSLFMPLMAGFLIFIPLLLLPWIGPAHFSGPIPLDLSGLFEWGRWQMVASHFFLVLSKGADIIVYALLISGAVILFLCKRSEKAILVAGTVICYILGVFLFFVVTRSPLQWHLDVAADRLLFEIKPLAVFITFYMLRSIHDEC